MALALQAVQNIAGRAPIAWLTAVDVSLVLTCAKEAPDSAVRNAALSLLEVLALKLPDTTLQHVLEVSQCHRGNHFCCCFSSLCWCKILVCHDPRDILHCTLTEVQNPNFILAAVAQVPRHLCWASFLDCACFAVKHLVCLCACTRVPARGYCTGREHHWQQCKPAGRLTLSPGGCCNIGCCGACLAASWQAPGTASRCCCGSLG